MHTQVEEDSVRTVRNDNRARKTRRPWRTEIHSHTQRADPSNQRHIEREGLQILLTHSGPLGLINADVLYLYTFNARVSNLKFGFARKRVNPPCHTHTHTRKHTHTHTHAHATHAHTNKHTHTHTHTHVHVHTQHTHTHTHTHTHARTQARIHTHALVHTHLHKCTHTTQIETTYTKTSRHTHTTNISHVVLFVSVLVSELSCIIFVPVQVSMPTNPEEGQAFPNIEPAAQTRVAEPVSRICKTLLPIRF